MYCVESWGSTYKTFVEPLFILQKKIIRIISAANRLDHSEPLFKNLSILPLKKLYFYHVCQLVYKDLNNIVPLKLGFVLCSNVHQHGTRQQTNHDLYIHSHKTNYYARSISYVAVKFYNVLPNELKNCSSIHLFKKHVKIWLHSTDIDIHKIFNL